MCDHPHDGRPALLSIGVEHPDGTIYTRIWQVCPAGAEEFAATLGPHLEETFSTPEAREAINAAMVSTPGVLILGGDL